MIQDIDSETGTGTSDTTEKPPQPEKPANPEKPEKPDCKKKPEDCLKVDEGESNGTRSFLALKVPANLFRPLLIHLDF